MFDFSALFSDPAFINAMATVGASLDPEGPAGAIGGMTKQMIRAKSKADLFQKSLGGGGEGEGISGITGEDVLQLPGSDGDPPGFMSGNAPSKLSGKITIDEDGKFTMSGDRKHLPDLMRGSSFFGKGQGQGGQITPQMTSQAPIQNPTAQPNISAQAKYANPFASSQPSLSVSDLAGLTSEDLNQVVQLMLSSQDLNRKTTADIYDATYQSGVLSNQRDRLAFDKAKFNVPPAASPIKGMPMEVYKLQSDKSKQYLNYKQKAAETGEKIVSRQVFEARQPTPKMRDLERISGPGGKELLSSASKLAKAERRPQDPLRRPLVTWTTATNELTKRFGKLDPTGMWAVTPELQVAHGKAQEFLVKLKNSGVEPLDAVNRSNDMARDWLKKVEGNYFNRLSAAERKGDESLVEHIQSQFNAQFGYTPTRR